MRLSVAFKGNYLPISYQMLGVSLIKEALEKVNPDYCEKMYNFEDKSNKQSKNFCFSVFLKDYEILEDKFKINDEVIFNFSTPDLEFGINLYNGLLRVKEFKYKDFILTKQRIFLNKEKQISTNEKVFKTLSPIFIKDKQNKHLLPDNNGFIEELNYISDLGLKNYRGYGLNKPLQFICSNESIKKKVVKEEIEGFKQKSDKKYIAINSFSGVFKLVGDIEDLNDLYMLGIGFKRGQGFGMVDIV